MKQFVTFLISTVLFVLSASLFAQAPPPSAEPPEAMKRLAPWVGKWVGEGWVQMGLGEPARFSGTEVVTSQVGGHVLVIDGLHYKLGTDKLSHHAFGVISMNPATGGYRFRSHLANGLSGDYTAEWKGGAFTWFLEIPGLGKQRFTITLDAGQWDEVGEMERNGEWVRFLEMHLKKQ